MIAPNDIWLYFIMDSNNRTCSWANGAVIKTSQQPLPQDPIGWKDIEIKFGTNEKYFSLQRSFSTQLKFIGDGASILRYYAYEGKGFEEDLYITIVKWNRTDGIYYLEYNGKLDFSRFLDDPYTGVTISTLEGGLLRYLNANEGVTYEIPCDGRNPKAQKVIFDGVTLQADIIYNAPKVAYELNSFYINDAIFNITLTRSLVNGNSSGVVINDPTLWRLRGYGRNTIFTSEFADVINNIVNPNHNDYFLEFSAPSEIILFGTISYQKGYLNSNGDIVYLNSGCSGTMSVYLAVGTNRYLLGKTSTQNDSSSGYKIPINGTFSFKQNDRAYLVFNYIGYNADNPPPDSFNVFPNAEFKLNVTVKTKQLPSTAFFLRPLDSLQAIVAKMTYGKYTADSIYFSKLNNEVMTCGDALRNINIIGAGIDGYSIKRSFADWFKDYDSGNCLGCKIVDNIIWVEPKEDLYGDVTEIFNVGEVSDFTITPDIKRVFNTIKTGSPDQTYQGVSQNDGKLEVNSTQEWLLDVSVIKKEYDITSKARKDPLGMEFIRQSLSSVGASYNASDNEVFMVRISDQTEQLAVPILTSVSITINHSPVIPQITSPNINAITTVHNDKPVIYGYASQNTKVGILVDGTQEGFTISDANGFWTYQIVASLSSFSINSGGTITSTGQHAISASYTDVAGVVLTGGSANTTANIIIDTTVAATLGISYPANNDNLYNNKPTIKGTGIAGQTITVTVDAVIIGTATVDNSCNWKFALISALSDNTHIISANGISISVTVASTMVTFPLITSINEGDTIYQNQPTVTGVAKPNEVVLLYLDFVTVDNAGNPTHLATVVADYYGDWGVTVPTAISDGAHIISTTPTVEDVFVTQSGYKLLRDTPYDSITGVVDDSIFNIIGMTPKQCLLAHGSYINSVNAQQSSSSIILTTAAKNKNLLTVKNGVTYSEREAINVGSLANPFFLPWVFKFKTIVPYTFDQILQRIPKGYLKFEVNGFPLYALPIGEMSYKPASESAQEWTVLASAKNNLSTFIQLSGSFLFIELYNKNMLSISRLNPLHIYKYKYVNDPKYNSLDIYDGAFVERFMNYIKRPDYFQKWQKSDTISLQFITAGLDNAITVAMFNSSFVLVQTFTMTPSSNQYIQLPYILQSLDIPLDSYADGNYVFLFMSGTTVLARSEWNTIFVSLPQTKLIEYSNTFNKLNGYFDIGWKPMIRVESSLSPYKPESDFVDYEDELKNIELLHGVPYSKREFDIGKPVGVPDWMALKLNEIMLLNNWKIEGYQYSRTPDSKMEDTIYNGYTMATYKIMVMKSDSDSNLVISNTDFGTPTRGLVATIDGQVFGQASGVTNITITK